MTNRMTTPPDTRKVIVGVDTHACPRRGRKSN